MTDGKHALDEAKIVWFPNQRVVRTVLQSVAGFVLAAVALFAAIAVFAPGILAELEAILPPAAYAWLVGFIAVCAAISGALSKLMAVPGVNAWLISHSPFGTAPQSSIIDGGTAGNDPNTITRV